MTDPDPDWGDIPIPYNDGYYNMRIGAPNAHNKLQLEDAVERGKVVKFKRGDYGGKLTSVDYESTHDVKIYWGDCPLGGHMTSIGKSMPNTAISTRRGVVPHSIFVN